MSKFVFYFYWYKLHTYMFRQKVDYLQASSDMETKVTYLITFLLTP